jgi:hypothetical protein
MGEGDFPRPGHALLIGYTMSPLQPAGASAAWRRQELALVAYHFASSGSASAPARGERQARERDEAQPAQARGAAPSAQEDQ